MGLAVLLSACGSSRPPATSRPGETIGGNLTMLAAASLTDAFKAEAQRFQAHHPAVRVNFEFGGSSTLVAQVEQGAPGDVIASADEANMQRLRDKKLVAGTPAVFALNRLQIVVAPHNPKHINGLASLAQGNVIVDLCQPAVPCGTYASQALAKAGVNIKPASHELDVKAVLTKVELGEADAGIVYATDVRAAGSKALGVDIPTDHNVIARYPVAVLKGAANASAATSFMDFLLSREGQAVLSSYGFMHS